MNKNRLRELLRKMLASVKPSAEVQAGTSERERHFLGDDGFMRIEDGNGESIELAPDSASGMGPSFCLIDEGYDAFEDYVAELNKDGVIGSKVSRKAVNQAIGA